jgi:hypothetical protein
VYFLGDLKIVGQVSKVAAQKTTDNWAEIQKYVGIGNAQAPRKKRLISTDLLD